MTQGQEPTSTPIRILAGEHQRMLIDQAADQLGRTRERFMLDVACREAEDILLDRVFFALDTTAYEQFLAILDNPPPPNDRLRRLMAMKAPSE
jgi:uncharacterized protein (DUF1778 family)